MDSSTTTTTTSAPSLSVETQNPPLAFIGKAGAGKTTAAEAAKSLYGYYRLSFAGPLKEVAVKLWGDDALLNRGYLQQLGNKLRDIDPDVWLNVGLREADQFLARGTAICFDDCRFPNEYNGLRDRGFTIIRLEAAEDTRVDRLQRIGKFQSREQLWDITETSLDSFAADYTIDTTHYDTLMEDITEAVAAAVDKIRRQT